MIDFSRLPRRAGLILGMTGLLLGSATAAAQTQTDNAGGATAAPADGTSTTDTPTSVHRVETYTVSPDSFHPPEEDPHPLLHDIEAYYTSPLHWDGKDWAYLGGGLALWAASHHYDTQVRTHFIAQGAKPLGGSSDDLQDALPMIGAVAGTWVYAKWLGSSDGAREVGNMVEAAGLSAVDAYALKIVAGRERPNQTSDPNKWRKSGSSFPSLHAAAAFAVGSVLAESGNDDNRWMRRFLGYGAVAGFTAFERLKHNAHWLSDDVAGAEIGGATAHFVLTRSEERREARANYSLSLVPIEGGAMLTYNMNIK
jgi:membrane-associated phospholipid phosphatase